MACHALQFDGGVDDLAQFNVAVVQVKQFRAGIDIIADLPLPRLLRDQRGGAVDLAQIDIQRAREILDELRTRIGDPSRPILELDYLERLIRSF